MESLSGERLKHVADNDAEYVQPLDMIGELREDNQALVARMIEIHDQCEKANDIATASLLENWIDQAQRWVWFLFETARTGVPAEHESGLDAERSYIAEFRSLLGLSASIAWGMAALIGIGAIIMMLAGRSEDIITTGITSTGRARLLRRR
jgi:hypothetical protein